MIFRYVVLFVANCSKAQKIFIDSANNLRMFIENMLLVINHKNQKCKKDDAISIKKQK